MQEGEKLLSRPLHLISCLKQATNFTHIQCSSVYKDAAQTKNGKMGMENVNSELGLFLFSLQFLN